ncbi:membrane metalloprotease [Flavobacterium sp.]|uniref:membrane metalloprotease n=1 Tax=Flavobacterium sp. TaxID=239 RepID=UPI003753DD46
MKKIVAILAIGLFLFVSCSKEDDSSGYIVNPNTNKQSTGSSSNDLLSDKKFKSMVVEVVYVDGFEPSATAINNLVAFLGARTYKPNGISVIKRAIPSPGKATFSVTEIAAIEDANRTKYNTSDQIAVWVFFVDGKSVLDTSTSAILGESYRNTSFVIFEKTVQGLSDSPLEPNRSLMETTIITHESGHILGLTNLGAPMQTNHEDTSHPKHCNLSSCLMYWASETGHSVSNIAPQLDAQCLADLRANGGR